MSATGVMGKFRADSSATIFIHTNRNSRGKPVTNFRGFLRTLENLESVSLPSGDCEMVTNGLRSNETTA